ncbi:MAG: thiolase family protein [Candidatus Kapaibacterium sp.]
MNSVIVSAVRTPIGAFMGGLSAMSAPQLGAHAIKQAVSRAGVSPDDVSEVIMGHVLQGGTGQAPGRQAAIYAGLPEHVPCMTINKVCGSGLKSVMLADQSITTGDSEIVVAGGQESMTNAPYFLHKARTGYRMGNGELIDMMIHDGLWDVYNKFHMGLAGELCAKECNISREEQDEFAVESYKRAQKAQDSGWFNDEISPITISGRKGDTIIDKDEEPAKVKFEKIPQLKPVFQKEGTVTAANASSIDDGASAVVVMSLEKARAMDAKPLAKVITYATHAQKPEWFTTAPVQAMKKAAERAGISLDDIDLFEINEAFATVPIVTAKELNIPYDKINIHGGAIALGHPIGASGARILTTLIYALKRTGKKLGMASLCIGGGEAVAMIVEV